MRVVIIIVCATGVILVVTACMAIKTSNEVMYKMAEYILKKMQESGLISEEEREQFLEN